MPIAPYLQLASAFKSELGVTVFHGQRITDEPRALLRKAGAQVMGAACIIELTFLDGRSRIDVPFSALISY